MSALHQLLADFAGRVNGHPALNKSLAGWSPSFFIEASDCGERFEIRIVNGHVADVRLSADQPGEQSLLLRACADVLDRVFSGRLSPLGAYTDGQLEVYGAQKDQIKLDVIALVLWGA